MTPTTFAGSVTLSNTMIPRGYTLMARYVKHPTNPVVRGDLCRVDATGIYVILTAHASLSVPQRWAREFADRLANTNPNFNRKRFLAACGVEEPVR